MSTAQEKAAAKADERARQKATDLTSAGDPVVLTAEPTPTLGPGEEGSGLDRAGNSIIPPEELAAAPVPSPVQGIDMNQFGAAIADAISKGMAANAPKRKVTLANYDPKTSFHPSKATEAKLTRACYQNGAVMLAQTMFDEEIQLLNAITHSGRYLDRKLEVLLVPNGIDDDVHLRYNNKTPDQRNALLDNVNTKGEVSKLAALLREVVTEQAKERAEDERVGAIRAQRNTGRR